jgi:hypothetical protein
MTIDNLYLNVDYKPASYRIVIGGSELTEFVSVNHTNAIQKVPTASIRIRGAVPPSVVFGARVTIDEGFVGAARQRVFTGTVLHPDNADATGKTIECQGMSAVLDNTYHKVVVTVDGSRTVPELIEDLLAASGAQHYAVNMPDWTAGAVVPQILSFQTYGEAITKLAEVNGGRWYETATGVIKVDPKDPIPGMGAWRTYFSMSLAGVTEGYPADVVSGRPRIRACGQVRKARDVKNQVWVRGAVLTQTNPDGSQSSVTLEERAYAPSPWVLNPDGSQAYNDELYSNEIIDTIAVAGAEAGRRVMVKNRLVTQVDIRIDGDPQVQSGVTVQVEDPSYSAVTGRWFVEAVATTLAAGRFETQLTLLGGPQSGGQIIVAPFANFLYNVEQEIMGDRPWDIVTFDGSPSIDPDGQIVSWTWSDNQTPPLVSGTGQTITVRIDPSVVVPPWEVTLAVVDNDGGTDTLTLTIPYEATAADVWIPSIFTALGTTASATPDGGITWNHQVIAGKTIISTGAKPADGVTFGVGAFGSADGLVYRTTDFCATAPTLVLTTPGGHPIEHIWWDINVVTRVWAITRNGLLYWSQDDGATWAVYDDLAAKFGLVSIRLARIGTPTAGGVWIFGGTGIGYPLICWDAALNHSWTGAVIGGELAADLAASGYPTDLYVTSAAAHDDGLAIILNSATHTPAIYFSASGALGDGSDWKRAVGDAGALAKTRGKWVELDLTTGHYALGFDDAAIYRMDVAAGVGTISAAPATFGTDRGNYALSLAWYENIDQSYLVATEDIGGAVDGTIYKTWDRFGTVAKVLPATGYSAAPAGARAKMIALGAPGQAAIGRLAIVHDAGGATTWDISYPDSAFSLWTNVALPATTTHERPRPICLTKDLWFVEDVGGFGDPTACSFGNRCNRELARSPDAGVTWAATVVGDETCNSYRGCTGDETNHFSRVAMDAGGRVWAARKRGTNTTHPIRVEIWYSDAQGATFTWHLAATLTNPGGVRYPLALLCHPTNQNIIALISHDPYPNTPGDSHVIVYMTENRGLSWTERGPTVASGDNFAMTGDGQASRFMMLPNGRIVIANRQNSSDQFTIHASDDKGDSWQLRWTDPNGGDIVLFTQGQWLNNGAHLVGLRVPTQNGLAGDMAVMESMTSGNGWTVRTVPNPTGYADNNWDAVYDPIDDVIYAQDGYFMVTHAVWRLRDATNGGVTWEDITANLAVPSSHWESIALIPRT